MPKNKDKKEIKITSEDLIFIYGSDHAFFKEKIIPNCFCTFCPPPAKFNSTIVGYDIFLNENNSIILRGFCSTCKNPMSRYLETGAFAEYAERIWEVRKKYYG